MVEVKILCVKKEIGADGVLDHLKDEFHRVMPKKGAEIWILYTLKMYIVVSAG